MDYTTDRRKVMIHTTVEIPRTEEQLRRIWGVGFESTESIDAIDQADTIEEDKEDNE